MRRKYIVLSIIIIILLFLSYIVFMSGEHNDNILDETTERVSKDYKITDDFVLVNIPKQEDSGEINNIMNDIKELSLTSSVFENQGDIPSKYSCDGENINPPLEISGVSVDAKSMVLIMDDPDAPTGMWNHWIRFNIPASEKNIKEGEEPAGVSGKGTGGNLGYTGPCPPDKKHRYFFKLYVIDTELTLPSGSSKEEVEQAMEGHILQKTELMGNYEREVIEGL